MQKSKLKIVHLTSAHLRYDTRIFIKMCSSLANSGFDVSLVVADGNGYEKKNNILIYDVGPKTGGRLSRFTKTVNLVFIKAKELNADIYHLHDPELIPIGLKLKKLGKKVIFDSHEDFPQQLLSKHYLNKLTRILLSKFFTYFERWACKKFDAVVTATPQIGDKFMKINSNTAVINNFPLLDELANSSNWNTKKNEIAYIGAIAEIRGIEQVLTALDHTNNVKLNLAGIFSDKILEDRLKNNHLWTKVNFFNQLDRKGVNSLLAKSQAGIVTFLPYPNHVNAQPNKMFEYMSAGLPVIASDFRLWKDIINGNQCGICINPLDSEAIGNAIQYIIDNPIEAEKMGKNGRKAIEEKYNWLIEESKLLSLYRGLF